MEPSTSYETRPLLRLLDDRQIAEIHAATLECLETTGAEVRHEEALSLLGDAGAQSAASRRQEAGRSARWFRGLLVGRGSGDARSRAPPLDL